MITWLYCQTFFNKTEITNMLGNYYDASQIDGVIDQKYIFSNPGGNLNQRWIRLGTITYPTNQLSDAKKHNISDFFCSGYYTRY